MMASFSCKMHSTRCTSLYSFLNCLVVSSTILQLAFSSSSLRFQRCTCVHSRLPPVNLLKHWSLWRCSCTSCAQPACQPLYLYLASQFQMRVALICAIIYLASAVWLFKPYPMGNDHFQHVFYFKAAKQTLFLKFLCKEKNVFSVSLTKSLEFRQHPRFNIFGNSSKVPHLSSNEYTFVNQCEFHYRINTDNLFQIRREGSDELLLTISDVQLQKDAFTFKIKDFSTKWGLGERFQKSFQVESGKWTIWNRDKPWRIDSGQDGLSDQTYGHQPVYLARSTLTKLYHLVYFKNTHGLIYEVNGQQIKYNVLGGNLQFIFFLGEKDPEAVLENYHHFIGAAHIPPFWSMGYHQCRWGYSSLTELQNVVSNFNDHDLPIDTIWTDLDYMDRKMIFTVDESNFPPAKFNDWLKREGIHYIPLIDVGVSVLDSVAIPKGKEMNVFLKNTLGNDYYVGQVWPGSVHFVDYLHPNATLFWKSQLKRLHDKIKFSGVWLDMNEPSNFKGNEYTASEEIRIQKNQGINMMTINVDLKHYSPFKESLLHKEVHAYYGHLSAVSTYQFLKEHGRPFIISRSNSVGTGMFAGHWTGDNVANWEFLKLSISGNFLFQIFGIQMVGADICGFHENTKEELCGRWMQLGSLYPFSRNHNEERHLSQQPYALGPLVLQTSIQSLKTRYALLKQFYSILVAKKGLGSFFRPVFFQFFSDEKCYQKQTAETQFLIGSFLMSAPIVFEQQTVRQVYFPGPNQYWYQFTVDTATGKLRIGNVFVGGTHSQIENKMPSSAPLFLRSGWIMFTNMPATRSSLLNNSFHLTAGMDQEVAKGFIMAAGDYSDEQSIDKCVEAACLLRMKLSRTSENNYILSWIYEGDATVFKGINIVSITVTQQGLTLTVSDQWEISTTEGQKNIRMR